MPDSAYSGKKPGYKKAPTQPVKQHEKPGYAEPNPAKNDTTPRRGQPTKRIGGSNPGAH